MINHYEILNVKFDATADEIKKQYRKLAKIYHPDKNGGSKSAEERFKEIQNAYEILSDENKRALYDTQYWYFQQGGSQYDNSSSNPDQNYQPTNDPSHPQFIYDKSEWKFQFWAFIVLGIIYYFYTEITRPTIKPFENVHFMVSDSLRDSIIKIYELK